MHKKQEIEHLEFLFEHGGFPKVLDYIHENISFDIKHNTDTSGWLEKKNFSTKPVNIEHGVRYRAAPTSIIESTLSKVSESINTEEAGFYDLGCGKGKVLCIVDMLYNYKEILGIDYYPDFINIAIENTKICNVQNAKFELGDMVNFKNYCDTSVIFLYNPADDVILKQVRDNLQNYTKKCILIYVKPLYESIFKEWSTIHKIIKEDPDHSAIIFTHGF